jgi:asparagine synthase (glutamine-hydrolysing)
VQNGLHALIRSTPAAVLNAALQVSTPSTARRRRSRSEWRQVAELLHDQRGDSFYRTVMSHWLEPRALVAGAGEPSDVFTDHARILRVSDFRKRMMYLDAVSYLPDDILVKVDRAGMRVSLETRMPLLDHRVVGLAWRLPMHLKVRDGQGKWVLRQVLHKHVPRELVERPKMGFGLPIDSWLRGPLREWAEALLTESRLTREGYLDASAVRTAWATHLGGRVDQHSQLWNVLMFQAWLESAGASSPVSATPELRTA